MIVARTSLATAAMLLLGLAGCTSPATGAPEPLPTAPPAEADCGAGLLGDYIGRKATDQVIATLREWHAGKPMRFIKPGMAVTKDYRYDRVNVMLDERDIILRFTCG